MAHTPEIKKGLINLLMFSLYSDERTIYREYVQNALDAINKAVTLGVLNASKDGWVKIDIDKSNRVISIKDNGCGIKSLDAARVLLNISASEKNGINQAGQFGIGRLVGGGYCHKLTFKTSYKGENKYSQIVFDVDKIWQMLNEDSTDYLATTVIEECTYISFGDESESEHYFEVILDNIKEESAPALLNIDGVVEYLSEVAPVEYKVQFETIISHSCQDCTEFEQLHKNIDKVQLFVNNTRIQKQYGLIINGTKDKIDRIEYFKLEDSNFGILGWGWFALTKYSIQIPSDDSLACIRLRKHNIQIGGNSLLSGREYWREERSNSYFYGEFFVTHPNIMPNAARDGLAPTPETNALNNKLREYFTFLKTLYTRANEAKKAIDKIKEGLDRMKKYGINDYNAKDLIDNKGIAKFDKLVKNATFLPLVRMLELYKSDFLNAVSLVETYKKDLTETERVVPKVQIEPLQKLYAQETINEENTISQKDNIQVETKITNYDQSIFVQTNESQQQTNNSNIYVDSAISNNSVFNHNFSTTSTIQKTADRIKSLESILNTKELFIIRRVFKVLSIYCPKNEHDQKLIEQLKDLIVKEFEESK